MRKMRPDRGPGIAFNLHTLTNTRKHLSGLRRNIQGGNQCESQSGVVGAVQGEIEYRHTRLAVAIVVGKFPFMLAGVRMVGVLMPVRIAIDARMRGDQP